MSWPTATEIHPAWQPDAAALKTVELEKPMPRMMLGTDAGDSYRLGVPRRVLAAYCLSALALLLTLVSSIWVRLVREEPEPEPDVTEPSRMVLNATAALLDPESSPPPDVAPDVANGLPTPATMIALVLTSLVVGKVAGKVIVGQARPMVMRRLWRPLSEETEEQEMQRAAAHPGGVDQLSKKVVAVV